MTRQLRLEWPPRADYSADSFIPGPATDEAQRRLENWRAWPGGALALIGPPGAGKSHLAAIWAARAGAVPAHAEALNLEGAAVLYEDADRNFDDALAFSLINSALAGEVAGVLFTARQRPVSWPVTWPDLSSRLRALSFVETGEPDETELAQILSKLLRDRQVRPRQSLMYYLLRRMERTPGGARDVVDALDRAAAERGERINLALARDVLSRHDEKAMS